MGLLLIEKQNGNRGTFLSENFIQVKLELALEKMVLKTK